jgi:hypothetical protein
MINNTDKVRVEQIFVVKQGLAATAPLNPQGTKFSNNTGAAITVNGNTFQPSELMLETGQLGIYNADTYLAIDATDTVSTAPKLLLAIKRDESGDNGPLPERPYEISRPIVTKNGVVFTGVAYADPLNNVFVIGDVDGNAGAVSPLDETRYSLTVAYSGRRTDILNGRTAPASFPEYTTLDYTTLGLATIDARDEMLQGLVYNGLQDSVAYRKTGNQAVPFAIDALGVGTGTLISALTIGQTIQLATNSAGEIFSLKLTESVVASLQSTLVVNGGVIPNTAKIILVDKTLAGTGASNVDMILYVATDQDKAYFDKIGETKTRIQIGLSKGFAGTVRKVELVKPFEGKGQGRNWRLYYEATDGLRRYDSTELSGLDGGSIHYNTPVSATGKYVVYTIMHSDVDSTSNGVLSESPLVNIILVEESDAATKTAIEAVLNPYFSSAQSASFDGEVTPGTGVVIP